MEQVGTIYRITRKYTDTDEDNGTVTKDSPYSNLPSSPMQPLDREGKALLGRLSNPHLLAICN